MVGSAWWIVLAGKRRRTEQRARRFTTLDEAAEWFAGEVGVDG
jgi:hypothetical protein